MNQPQAFGWNHPCQTSTPVVHAKDKPVLFDAQGTPIVIKRTVGFAAHPDVPTGKVKGKS
jgi:hypothetical protein